VERNRDEGDRYKDIWSVHDALMKYAKGRSFSWKEIRREMESFMAARTVKVLKNSASR
jgi:hypothetical protein